MRQWRAQDLSLEQRETLNSRVVGTTDSQGNILQMPDPFKCRWATWTHKCCSGLNASLFKHHLKMHHKGANPSNIPKSAIVTCASARWDNRLGTKLADFQCRILVEHCGTHNCKTNTCQRCEPLLCLHTNCHLTSACSGTTGLFQKVHLKPGRILKPMKMHGCWVHSVSIEDVVSVSVKLGHDKVFHVEPRIASFNVDFQQMVLGKRTTVKKIISITQIPVMNSLATVGSRIGGETLKNENLLITQWAKETKGWEHSVISTVRNLEKLFLMEPAPVKNCSPPKLCLDMMSRLRNSILATPTDVQSLTFPLCGFIKTKREGICKPNPQQQNKKGEEEN